MKSFFTRLISGIVLLAIIISTGIVGGPVLFGFTLLISLIGYWEFLQVFGLEKKAPGIWGMIFVVLYYGTVYMGSESGGSAASGSFPDGADGRLCGDLSEV